MTDNPPTTPAQSPNASPTWAADSQLTEVIHPVVRATSPGAGAATSKSADSSSSGSSSSAAGSPGSSVAAGTTAQNSTFAPDPLPVPDTRPAASAVTDDPPQRIALVVLVGMSLLAIAFIVMIFVNVTSEAINALAVIAAPIAAMVAAYYGITLSIQQVKNERAEKQKGLARAEVAEAISRETEVWSAQMESGLRVAMVKLAAAGVDTSEVTKAAGTPADFF